MGVRGFLALGGQFLCKLCKTEFQIVSTVNHFPCKRMTFMVMFNLSRIVIKHIQGIFCVFFFESNLNKIVIHVKLFTSLST